MMDKRLRQIEKAVADIRELEVNGPSNQLVHLPTICGYFEFMFTELSYCRSIIEKQGKAIEAAREVNRDAEEGDRENEDHYLVYVDVMDELKGALAELEEQDG